MTQTRERQVGLTGTTDEIAAKLARLVERPETVQWHADQRVEQLGPGRGRLHVTVLETVTAPTAVAVPPWWQHRWPYVTVGTVGGVAAVGWAAVTVINAVATWVALYGRAALGLLGVLVALYLWGAIRTGCPGLHCVGCSGH